MGLIDYDPFGKDIEQVTTDDLASLREVTEGWYTEYKQELPSKASRIAKSIGAFANTRGGWLWYGIRAPSGSLGCAEAYPGVASSELPKLLRAITDAVAAHLSPAPYFDTHVFQGGSSALSLPADKSIIAVRVPVGRQPPYVHSSGVIFVRVGDKSDPVPEADRGRLIELVERARRTRKRLKRYLTEAPPRNIGQPHARFFIMPDPYGERQWRHSIKFDDFAAVMRNEQPTPAADEPTNLFPIKYDYIQSTMGGFLARGRQARLSDPTITFRFETDGTVVASLPVNSIKGDDRREIGRYLDGYQFAERFLALCEGPLHVADVSLLFLILADTFSKAKVLRGMCAFPEDDQSNQVFGRLTGVEGLVPFIDTEWFVSHCESYGVPIVGHRTVSVPGGEEGEILFALSNWKKSEEPDFGLSSTQSC
jgi:schlafen family protein